MANEEQFHILKSGVQKWGFVLQVNARNKRVVLMSTDENVPPFDALKALKIDGVFFAGEWADALTLIRQVKSFTAAGAHVVGLMTGDRQSLVTGQGERSPLPDDQGHFDWGERNRLPSLS